MSRFSAGIAYFIINDTAIFFVTISQSIQMLQMDEIMMSAIIYCSRKPTLYLQWPYPSFTKILIFCPPCHTQYNIDVRDCPMSKNQAKMIYQFIISQLHLIATQPQEEEALQVIFDEFRSTRLLSLGFCKNFLGGFYQLDSSYLLLIMLAQLLLLISTSIQQQHINILDSVITSDYFIIKTQRIMRNNRRQPTPIQEDHQNYKQLYLQCKKNVAIFMKHVDTQMSSILQKHQLQKKKLQQEIQRLRAQLKEQNHQTSIHISKASSLQSHNRKNSQSKISSTVSKQTVEECLAKFNRLQFKPKETPQKRTDHEASFISQRRTNTKSICQEEKQNLIPINLTENNDLGDLKLMNGLPRRDKRIKEKKISETEKVENIKDVLKDIRGKLNSRQKSSLREKDEQSMNIISPELFAMQRSKIC